MHPVFQPEGADTMRNELNRKRRKSDDGCLPAGIRQGARQVESLRDSIFIATGRKASTGTYLLDCNMLSSPCTMSGLALNTTPS